MDNSYKYFCNKECQYFPCHDIPEDGNFNCMFCYCPLYLLGDKCGGDFKYIGPYNQIKDCSACNFPHQSESYNLIMNTIRTIPGCTEMKMKDEYWFKRIPEIGMKKRYGSGRQVIVPDMYDLLEDNKNDVTNPDNDEA